MKKTLLKVIIGASLLIKVGLASAQIIKVSFDHEENIFFRGSFLFDTTTQLAVNTPTPDDVEYLKDREFAPYWLLDSVGFNGKTLGPLSIHGGYNNPDSFYFSMALVASTLPDFLESPPVFQNEPGDVGYDDLQIFTTISKGADEQASSGLMYRFIPLTRSPRDEDTIFLTQENLKYTISVVPEASSLAMLIISLGFIALRFNSGCKT